MPGKENVTHSIKHNLEILVFLFSDNTTWMVQFSFSSSSLKSPAISTGSNYYSLLYYMWQFVLRPSVFSLLIREFQMACSLHKFFMLSTAAPKSPYVRNINY